jgi:hypothetical protein
MMAGGPYLSKTLAAVDGWLANNGLHPSPHCVRASADATYWP